MGNDRISPAPAKVLVISSQVAVGPVGNTAMLPALQALGVTPIALPTIILSFHPGLGTPDVMPFPAARLDAMLAALDKAGFLEQTPLIVSGYFGDAAQVDVIGQWVKTLKQRDRPYTYLCDPVMGDTHTGIYVKPEVARRVRDVLVPLCDLMTPNAFELGWLTGKPVEDLTSARQACAGFFGKQVIVTSLPEPGNRLATVHIQNGVCHTVSRAKREGVPHGTGDVFMALVAGMLAKDRTLPGCLDEIVTIVDRVIAASGSEILEVETGLRGLG